MFDEWRAWADERYYVLSISGGCPVKSEGNLVARLALTLGNDLTPRHS